MIYFIQNTGTKNVKIGLSQKAIQTRLADLQVGAAERLKCLLVLHGDRMDERELHSRFDRFHIRGEWYEFSPDIVNFINDNKQHCLIDELGLEGVPRRSKKMVIRPYSKSDYAGELNLRAAERQILIKLNEKYQGCMNSISMHLTKTIDTIERKFMLHGIIPIEKPLK